MSGKAIKGPVAGGTVQAFAINATTGLKTGAALSTATTGLDGSFTLMAKEGARPATVADVAGRFEIHFRQLMNRPAAR